MSDYEVTLVNDNSTVDPFHPSHGFPSLSTDFMRLTGLDVLSSVRCVSLSPSDLSLKPDSYILLSRQEFYVRFKGPTDSELE